MDMEEDELLGLFEVMGSLLEDPSWAQTHPSPCSDTPWPGVECELLEQSSTFHVTKIHVGPDVLTPPCKASAQISASLQKLPYLKTLSLISCFTNSPISLNKSLFGSLPFLEHLSLESNPSLSGEIPSSISNLGNLVILCLSQNNLIGQIPKEIGGLFNLQQLDLSRNNLTGPIPEEIGGLGNLAILDFSWNYLGSFLPDSIGGLRFLEKIDLSYNKFQGHLPRGLGGLKRLVLLDLSHNALTGQIPDEFSGLQQLQYLIMDGNPLNASFPTFIGSLARMSVLSLSGCGLTGPILTTFPGLTSLTALSLDDNRLNGTVPAEIGLLPCLDTLNLSRNQFIGELLFSRDFMSRLGERLDFRENNGLCANYEGASSRLSRNPICSSSMFSGETNKTLAGNGGAGNMKPKMYKGDNKSSNASDLEKMLLQFVCFVIIANI
ncbi:piriformospora indica-insensitive protein 2 [Phtheirospermum japonicum]|uniref:Piriformospora indica-insensitive protein 2 n=1 Tax=Phtheirospermum japonicum TaxID=374723 RepID=A0A830B8V6_9LAMI|nr:piriformospora indica-insensitive protein 2 [Phtheirospermum japonicum]